MFERFFSYSFRDSTSLQGSSLIYKTRARHERHKCDTSDTSATRVRHERQVRHEWKIFDFDNCTSKNIFSHSSVYYMASERLQGEEQFHSKYYLWKCLIPVPKCVWLHQNAFDCQNCTTKTEICNGKSYIKKLYASL